MSLLSSFSSINWILAIVIAALCLLSVGCGVAMKTAKIKSVTPNESPEEFSVDRYQKDIDRFKKQKKWFKRRSSDSVLFTGSSTITLWKSINKDLSPHPILNRGFGGSTLIEQNYFFTDIVKDNQPTLVFLYAGENDLSLGKSVEETHQQLLTFFSKCEKHLPNTKVVYLAMKPSPSKWYLWSKMKHANTLAETYCSTHPNYFYLNPSEGLLGEDGKPLDKFYLNDKLHLSNRGYNVWLGNIKPVLDRLRSSEKP